MKSVAILGCGPAGLLVAHAATLSGWDLRIYSRKRKSKLYGAQYLHAEIPNLDCGMPKTVTYTLRGTPEQYRRKVYGDDWDGTVSPEDLTENHFAWDIRKAYDKLWDQYESEIRELEIYWSVDGALQSHLGERVDLVISTIPRKIWAKPGDVFESQRIWALGDDDPDGGLASQNDFTVICDGTNICNWYRSAKIFGHSTLEWPWREDSKPMYDAVVVEKPLRHNSKAASDFIHLGRYGAWQKGILSSDAFFDAMKVFANDRI